VEASIPWRNCSAIGRTLSGVARGPPNIAPMKGSMSTTISRPTSSGWRAATSMAQAPPSEWPTIAGRCSPASRI